MKLHLATAGSAAALVAAACATDPAASGPAFAEPRALAQCPAESAVDWEGTTSWLDLDAAAERQAQRPRTHTDLGPDDVAVIFYAGPSMTVGRTNHARIVRRDGVWTMETAESPDSLMPPPPPPPPPPPGAAPVPDETFACTGYHLKSRGEPGERLITAVEAFLADGCRAHLPNVIPGLLFMREGSGRDCADGAGYRLRIETASAVEDYSVGCFVPGSTLETLMRALEGQRTPLDAALMRPEPAFTVTLDPSTSRYRIAQACRDIAEERGYAIDYDDPFQW